MISIIVTAYEDPKTTKECIKRILTQKNFKEEFELIASSPDEPTKKVIIDYKKKYPKIIKYVKQEYGSGKNKNMNNIMKIVKGNILIWTDGNKLMKEDTINKLLTPFSDKKVGIVGGTPIPLNDRSDMFGYWAHLLTYSAMKLKELRYNQGNFVEHSAPIMAFRKELIKEIPLDVAEDAIISYMIYKQGYKSVYVPDAMLLVKFPTNLPDWIKQKTRSIKAHEAINKYIEKGDFRMKSFKNEALYGIITSFGYPKNLKEIYWTFLLYLARFYIWIKSFYELNLKKDVYNPDWSRSESTKALDYTKKK